MSAARVLLVEDERDIAEALSFALETQDYEVELVADGVEGRERAMDEPPDLLILDVMLPGMNGYEISRHLKDWMDSAPSGKPFPILLITARRVATEEREEFLAIWSRSDDVLYKPFDLDDLFYKTQELLSMPAV